jgi:hypothetical protein
MLATAPPARRFLLLEVPGPWTADVFPAAGLSPAATRAVRSATAAAEARLLLIRRPGRHPADPGARRRWAVVERGRGVRWGHWRTGADLRELDVVAELARIDRAGSPGERPLALVCTQGRHDVCCAIEGRPVAAAAARDVRVAVWECSHVGGDRFAANLLLLPSGLMFGGVTAATAPAVLDAALVGRVVLEHFRGRVGDPGPVQAAQWHLLRALGEDRPDRVRLDPAPATPNASGAAGTVSLVGHHAGARYRLELAWSPSAPNHLTCRATADTRVRTYQLVSISAA